MRLVLIVSGAGHRSWPDACSRHRTMHGAYTLAKPIVAVPVGATGTSTLPSGASIEVQHGARAEMVQVRWNQRSFVVHLPDLLDACRVEDVGEIVCPDGWGSFSAEAE
jgi:hypothetical protein